MVFPLSGDAQELLLRADVRWAYLLLLSFGLAYVGTPLFYAFAHRIGALDIPGGRKGHEVPTALLGGAAIFSAFAITVFRNSLFDRQLTGVLLAGSLIFLVGLIDDLRALSPKIRLAVQLVGVAIVIHSGVVITFLPAGPVGLLGEWLITAIWIIGITNAINFLDGMDGLAAGAAGISAFFFGLVALQNNQPSMVYLALPLLGACTGFLPYNFRPRRRAAIFMGDAGSTFLGFMMASLGLMGDWARDEVVRLIVPILILGLPIFDTTFTTIMRIKSGSVRSFKQWIECAQRDHIHDRLRDLRVGRTTTVVVLYVITVWLGLSALALRNTTGFNALLQVAQSAIVFILLGVFMIYVQRKYDEIQRGVPDDSMPESSSCPHEIE